LSGKHLQPFVYFLHFIDNFQELGEPPKTWQAVSPPPLFPGVLTGRPFFLFGAHRAGISMFLRVGLGGDGFFGPARGCHSPPPLPCPPLFAPACSFSMWIAKQFHASCPFILFVRCVFLFQGLCVRSPRTPPILPSVSGDLAVSGQPRFFLIGMRASLRAGGGPHLPGNLNHGSLIPQLPSSGYHNMIPSFPFVYFPFCSPLFFFAFPPVSCVIPFVRWFICSP